MFLASIDMCAEDRSAYDMFLPGQQPPLTCALQGTIESKITVSELAQHNIMEFFGRVFDLIIEIEKEGV